MAVSIANALNEIEAALSGRAAIDPARIVEPIAIICADEEILLHGGTILAAIEQAGCQAPVQFIPLSTDYRSDVLWRNRLSLAITTILYAPQGLKQRKVYDEDLVCLVRSDHPLAAAMGSREYLAAEHLLIAPLGGTPQGFLDVWLKEQGMERTIRLISHSFGSAHALVRETGLVATLPRRQANRRPFGDALKAVPLPFSVPPFSVHIFWSERYDSDPSNRWLRDTVNGAMRDVRRR